MKGMYADGQYLVNNPTWHDEESIWKANHIINLIKKNNLSPKTICDIGCGAGGILDTISNSLGSELKYYGYEISNQAFEICNRKTKENMTFTLGDFPDNNGIYADIVMALDVFEHVEDYYGFLRRFKKQGQYKIFHIPLEYNVYGALSRTALVHSRKAVGHIHYFTKETAIATLEDTGYEIIDYFYTNYPLDCLSPKWTFNLLEIVRKLFYQYNPDFGAKVIGNYNLAVLTR